MIRIAKDGVEEGTPSTAETKSILKGMLKKELEGADDTLAIETGIRKFIEWIRSGKLKVKLYREQNIHAKVYIMTPVSPVPDVNHGYVITGSSNFSRNLPKRPRGEPLVQRPAARTRGARLRAPPVQRALARRHRRQGSP